MNICILAETDKSECRTPLLPLDIENIRKKNKDFNFYYEKSNQRIFKDKSYKSIGCKEYINQKIDLFISIKSLKKKFIKEGCGYLLFTKTIQKQPHNLELLKKILNKQGSLIDYELIKHPNGKKLFLEKELNIDTLKSSAKISRKLSILLPKIIKSLSEDTIEENFIVKKGYLNYRYIQLMNYLM